jgi:putative transcriptional regulator
VSAHVDAELYALLAGDLDVEARAQVEMHVRDCVRCARLRAVLEDAAAASTFALAPATPPAPAARARLLAALDPAETMLARLTQSFDLPRERAADLIDEMKRRTSPAWRSGPFPGMALYDFTGGPAVGDADCGLIFFPCGLQFPVHKHLGREVMLVLQGGFTDRGRHLGPGDLCENAATSEHGFVIDPEGCTAAVSLEVGIEIDGVPIRVKP